LFSAVSEIRYKQSSSVFFLIQENDDAKDVKRGEPPGLENHLTKSFAAIFPRLFHLPQNRRVQNWHLSNDCQKCQDLLIHYFFNNKQEVPPLPCDCSGWFVLFEMRIKKDNSNHTEANRAMHEN
jgi:hypothetical protein